jgi:zinc transport system substrate-binding protein
MDTKRLIIFGGIITAIVIGVSFFSPKPQSSEASLQTKPIISVSTFALYEIAKTVAGDSVEVHPIIPLGTDAHMFTPNPSNVAEISKSSLFVYNGAGFESWAENLKNALPKTTQVVDMSRYVVLLKSEVEHHGEETDGEHHHEGAFDPHYWLDIDNMIKMTQVLDTEFSKLNPAEAERFHGNAATYIGELQRLKAEYTSALAECKNRTLVSNHDAFGYLASVNKLENVSVIGLSSDEQPSAKNIADIIATVKEHGVKTIFFEEFINDNVSQTIARETGAKAVALQPLENISQDELKSHQTYLTIMRENLKKLREAMECR